MPAPMAFAPITSGDLSASAVETARQYALVRSEALNRMGLTTLAYGFCAVYLPAYFCLLAALVNFACEYTNMRLMRGLDPAAQPGRNLAMLASGVIDTSFFSITAGMIWLQDPNLAKPFAVGLIMMTLVNQASVRSVNLQMAVSGLGTSTFWIVVFVFAYWWDKNSPLGLIFTLAIVAASIAHLISLMTHNNAMHRASLAAESAALAADAAKSQFLAQMSHELRLPLNAILGMGDMELSQARSDDSRNRLQLLVTSGRDLSAILDDILDLAAIEKNALRIQIAPCAPRDVVAMACNVLRGQLAQKGLTLTLNLAENLPNCADLDARRLRQCVLNLISNAGKFTVNGGVRVDCARVGPLLQIDVIDTGGGVPEAMFETVFEPFHRGSGLQLGTGLGLTIGRSLARAMGGDLHLIPHLGGAHFRLLVPMQLSEITEKTDEPADDFSALRVLVVDDIETNHLVAAAYLSMLGVRADRAISGVEALAHLAKTPCDLVLLDMNMPGLSGLETLARIRAMKGTNAAVMVAAMTSNDSQFDNGRYANIGLQGHLLKPLSLDRVRAVLQAAQHRN